MNCSLLKINVLVYKVSYNASEVASISGQVLVCHVLSSLLVYIVWVTVVCSVSGQCWCAMLEYSVSGQYSVQSAELRGNCASAVSKSLHCSRSGNHQSAQNISVNISIILPW